jgi:transketolase
MCGDGCLMEGISYEATSLAGHLQLNNLVILYDDNGITIDGTTDVTFTENVIDRFKALQWNILIVDNGDTDINSIYIKLKSIKENITNKKPTILFVKTTIGYGSKGSGTSSVHGSPLGIENTKDIKRIFNFDETQSFIVDDDVKKYFLELKSRKIKDYKIIQFNNNNILPINKEECIDKTLLELSLIKNGNKNYATRDISNILLNILVKNNPHIIVGSADLSESNKTSIFTDYIKPGNFNGQYLHYGIREHAMAGIANGISTYDIIPIISTFLVFITYCLASIRMAALSSHKVIYILTHDSVFLGEDGPTHQPIESLTILRSIPNLLTIRPCDVNETSGAYKMCVLHNGPIALILTRQVLLNIDNSCINKVKYGGYIIYEQYNNGHTIDLIIIASGSEVSLAIETCKKYIQKNIRVVSMPCVELFDRQNIQYKEDILLFKNKNIKRMSIEAGCTLGWYKYVDYAYGIDTFGISAKINDIKDYFGFTIEKIIEYIEKL